MEARRLKAFQLYLQHAYYVTLRTRLQHLLSFADDVF